MLIAALFPQQKGGTTFVGDIEELLQNNIKSYYEKVFNMEFAEASNKIKVKIPLNNSQ